MHDVLFFRPYKWMILFLSLALVLLIVIAKTQPSGETHSHFINKTPNQIKGMVKENNSVHCNLSPLMKNII